jgi:hypothetical protein
MEVSGCWNKFDNNIAHCHLFSFEVKTDEELILVGKNTTIEVLIREDMF